MPYCVRSKADGKNSTWHPVSQTGGRNFGIIQELKRQLFQDLKNIVINLFGVKCVNYFYHSTSLISIFPFFMPYFMHLIQMRANVFWLNVIYIVYNRTMINCMNNYQLQLNNSDG